MKKCPAAVPCATTDEESGSNLKLGPCVDQPYVYSVQDNYFGKSLFFQMSPCIKLAFRKLNSSLILDLPCALYSVYTPSVGVVGLAEYVCTHPILNFYRGRYPDFVLEDVESGFRPAPNSACGVGPVQDVFAGAIL